MGKKVLYAKQYLLYNSPMRMAITLFLILALPVAGMPAEVANSPVVRHSQSTADQNCCSIEHVRPKQSIHECRRTQQESTVPVSNQVEGDCSPSAMKCDCHCCHVIAPVFMDVSGNWTLEIANDVVVIPTDFTLESLAEAPLSPPPELGVF